MNCKKSECRLNKKLITPSESYRNFIDSNELIILIANNNDRGTSAIISIHKKLK